MKELSPYKRFAKLSDEKKEAVFQECEEFRLEDAKPLSPELRKLDRLARRRGRPRVGEGAAKIRVSMERGLLRKVDARARKEHLSRSELIAQALHAMMTNAA